MAADRAELERLIRAADAAGDGEAVKVLFGEMDRLGAVPQATTARPPQTIQQLTDSVPIAGEQPIQQRLPSFMDRVKADAVQMGRLLTPIPRGIIKGVVALPGMAMDAGVGARNLLTGSNYEAPSKMLEAQLDKSLPLPGVPGDKTLEFGTSLISGFKMPSITQASSKPLAPANFLTAKQTAKAAEQAAAKQAIAEGQKRGVPVFADDVLQSPMLRRAGVAAEQVPFVGTSAGRAAQNTAAQTAVASQADRMSGQIADDIPVAIQKSMGRRLGQFKEAAGKLYDRVATKLDPAGEVPRTNMAKAIQEQIAAEQKLGSIAKSEVQTLLKKYAEAPAGNFSMMREIRSQLGNDISDFYTGSNSTIGAKGVGSLQAIKNALERDMQEFATKQGPDMAKAWRAADGFYRANIAQFKEAGFRDFVKTTEPEKVWRYLVSQGSLASRAEKMYSTLDNSGKQAVRLGLVKEAQSNATNPQGVFSPARFAKYMEDHSNAVSQFFKGRDLKEIQGLTNLMRTVQRAGQFAENPPTGQRLIPLLMGGAAVASPSGAAGAAAGTYGFTKLLQTESGRNLLLLMSRTAPGSVGAQKLAAAAAKLIGKTGPVVEQELQ